MLSLRWTTPAAWVRRVEDRLDEVLVDHAHCEKKAAGFAMNMIFSYVEYTSLTRPLADVVKEELDHFQMVLDLMERRGVTMTGQPQSRYGGRLAANIRTAEPEKLLDRLLVAALIEARSCERFTLLAEHLGDRELAEFYRGLLESEARHFGLYTRLARQVSGEKVAEARLLELAREEARIIQMPDPRVRLHA
jgi:tRNA-(ms[2]io[6]A)-hydroxylase